MDLLSLFSGIGGFSLAWKWCGGKTIQFVEIDPFCQKVLAKHFPGVPIHDDIKTFTYASPIKNDERERGNMGNQTEGGEGGNAPAIIGNQYGQHPFLLTGGFPCQPFSCAGKRRGKEDDRYLWPEMLRVISDAKPTWVIAENVNGLTSMVEWDCFPEMDDKKYTPEEMASGCYEVGQFFERGWGSGVLEKMLGEIEEQGYESIPFVIPACSKNAPHERKRIWIVAHANNPQTARQREYGRGLLRESEPRRFSKTDCHTTDSFSIGCAAGSPSMPGQEGRGAFPCDTDRHAPDTDRLNGDDARHDPSEVSQLKKTKVCGLQDAPDTSIKDDRGYLRGTEERQESESGNGIEQGTIADTDAERLQERKGEMPGRTGKGNGIIIPFGRNRSPWQESWLAAAARLCTLDDGLPGGLARPKGWRVNALKAVGNTIVPQIAYIIMKAILESIDGNR